MLLKIKERAAETKALFPLPRREVQKSCRMCAVLRVGKAIQAARAAAPYLPSNSCMCVCVPHLTEPDSLVCWFVIPNGRHSLCSSSATTLHSARSYAHPFAEETVQTHVCTTGSFKETVLTTIISPPLA